MLAVDLDIQAGILGIFISSDIF